MLPAAQPTQQCVCIGGDGDVHVCCGGGEAGSTGRVAADHTWLSPVEPPGLLFGGRPVREAKGSCSAAFDSSSPVARGGTGTAAQEGKAYFKP